MDEHRVSQPFEMNPAATSFANSFLMASRLSVEKLHSRCFFGVALGSTFKACSINSLGTPGISAGFHANTLLGAPPSAIDRRPAHNLTAMTRSPPVFGRRPRRLRRGPVRHRQRRREANSGEDRGAYGEDRFVTGEDEEKRREAKTEAPTVKTSSSQSEDEEKRREAKTEAPTVKTGSS